MTLIYFILVLGVTVLVHEFGHFLFAKRAGIYVYEFSIGMGPKLLSKRRKNDETEYCLRLLPSGGFVQMAGEEIEEDEKIPKNKRMQSKTWMQRFLTIVAGVLFNFIFAILLFFIIGLFYGVPQNKSIIASVEPNYPIAETNVRAGDQILKINGKNAKSQDMLLLQMQVETGKELTIQVKHEDGTIENVKVKPKEVKQDGVTSYVYGFALDNQVEHGFFAALKYGFVKTYNLLLQMIFIIFYLCTGALELSSLSGPVGIYTIVGETAKVGLINLVYLVAYLCVNVGFINLLPIPAFDGVRILFLIIEKIKGKPVDAKVENTIHSIGFLLLMALMILITYNDIVRIFFH